MSLARRSDHERLSARARAYLTGVGLQHAVIGYYAMARPDLFSSPAFRGIKDAIPGLTDPQSLVAWSCILLTTAALCFSGAVLGSEGVARSGLLLSVVVEGMWLCGYIASWVGGAPPSPVGLAVWSAMLYRDLTMLRNPLRNPFEPLIRRILSPDPEALAAVGDRSA